MRSVSAVGYPFLPSLLLAPWLALLLVGCVATSPSEARFAELAPLNVSETEIHGVNGTQLLDIEDIPETLRVDSSTEFGAAEAFSAASLSPDGRWLVLATTGAAHGAGWLVPAGEREPWPAAFQYGGEVAPGPWSENGRYATFVLEGPAPTRTLVVIDSRALGKTVNDNARPVRIPAHTERLPAGTEYRVLEWHDDTLHFEVEGQRYRYKPATGGVRRNDAPPR
ncbi:hypothetical protein [Billgrantia saliphila]|uniref:hypothetical protein n=1 Tax=Billgrantia saliphila TaxID=1848458 RepID=UPI000CE37F0A|nr:hypothetical protein [Halomonas saliphila]